jgi:RHS repeat-associated protein
VLSATGSAASANPMRFSTKYQDSESGLYYYGFRYYNPNTGRWLSCDPLEEYGALNIYVFVSNNSIVLVDEFGLSELAAGTTIKRRLQGPKRSYITVKVGSQFNQNEKVLASEALCLVRKLLETHIFPPFFSDLYWADELGGTRALGAVFYKDPKAEPNRHEPMWVFIHRSILPDENKPDLLAMTTFGITLAHEFDHYYTESDDENPGKDPESRIDVPTRENLSKAKNIKIFCRECKRHEPAWKITDLADQYACDCDINLGLGRK